MLREAATHVDAGLQTAELVQHAFQEYDRLTEAAGDIYHHNKVGGNADCSQQEIEDSGVEDDIMVEGDQGPSLSNSMRDVLEDSEQTPLFAGAKISSLSATLLLLNVCRTYGCSNLFISELLHMLHHSFLPEPNTLPTSEYAAQGL
jgi:hypothetical protein